MPPEDYDIEYFHRAGFQRRQCPSCGRHFWTQGEQTLCGETPCVEYSFIGKSPMVRSLGLSQMREAFLSFFEAHGHQRVKRYPIVARWRQDVFYTQASIYPFQPWVIEGLVKPPANPLCIAQPCVRFNDLDNVGKTGRHLSMFEMMAHHAFNFPGKFIYFKDRTTELCHEFFTKDLGVKPELLAYVEAWWEGGGNSGPCFEVTLEGNEPATLVFMQNRDVGGKRIPMETQVVDTGYGLERLTWISQGAPSAYEAVFGHALKALKVKLGLRTDPRVLTEYSKVAGAMSIESHADLRVLRERVAERLSLPLEELVAEMAPLENLYTICDHSRALVFVLNDGVVPSNNKEGYFARLLVRRARRAMDVVHLDLALADVVDLQIQQFKDDFPELAANRDSILRLVGVEEDRYRETLAKGRAVVGALMEERGRGSSGLRAEDLVDLYDSHGLTPEVVQEFAGVPVDIPDDFFSRVAQRHLKTEEPGGVTHALPPELPPTEILYYHNPRKFDFSARLVDILAEDVVLDRTYFYPEGGGQEADRGTIGGHPVVDVQRVGNVVLHRIEGPIKLRKGKEVRCHIDAERRMNLLRHHTATHIVNGAARKVLGSHVWQAGAHKAEDKATLDVTHYDAPTEEQLDAIEALANDVVLQDLAIHQTFMERDAAEGRYGFTLYQGGAVPGKEIRVVDIEGFDVEACGGTHALRTSEVGPIKILRSKRIQDGVVRLEYLAGEPAVRYLQRQGVLLRKLSHELSVPPEELPQAVASLQGEARELRREVEKAKAAQVGRRAEDLLASAPEVGGVRLVSTAIDGSVGDLQALSREATDRPGVLFLGVAQGEKVSVLVSTSSDVTVDVASIAQAMAEPLGGKAGGRGSIAQGAGPRIEGAPEALERGRARASEILRRRTKD